MVTYKKNVLLKNWTNLLLVFILFFPLLTSCGNRKSTSLNSTCVTDTQPCLEGQAIIELTTVRGSIKIKIDGESAPITAGNFLDLVTRGIYNKVVFHRVINSPVPFVVQAGDPSTKSPNTPKSSYGTGSFIDPQTGQTRFIPLEIKLKKEAKPFYNKLITNPTDIAQIQLIHKTGSVAMARSQGLASASSQFYIALKSLPELDGRYAVFGEVIDGMDVVRRIQQGDSIIKATVIKK